MKKHKTLIEKWHEYCRDNKKYDKCEFHFLFHQEEEFKELTYDQLLDILKYYDCKHELMNRILILYDFLAKRNRISLSRIQIENLVKEDILTKIEFCESYLDLKLDYISKEKVINFRVIFFENENEFSNAIRKNSKKKKKIVGRMLNECVDEAILCNIDTNNIVSIYGIREALYGLVGNYPLIDYVLSVFVSESIDLSRYLTLRQAGADYTIIGSDLFIKLEP